MKSSSLGRIAFFNLNGFVRYEFTNGATIQYREMFERLSQRGVRCSVVTISDGRWSPRKPTCYRASFERVDSFVDGVLATEYLVPELDVETCKHATEQALALDFDQIIMSAPFLLDEVLMAFLDTIQAHRIPVWFFFPDNFFPRSGQCQPALYKRFRKYLSQFTLICPSRFIAEQVVGEFDLPFQYCLHLFSSPTVVDDPALHTQITLINPHPSKGIEVFERVAQALPEHKFTVVGAWSYSMEYTSPVPNMKAVPFRRDMSTIWRFTRILMVPSFQEAFGRVVVEAMLQGIPVITHAVGGLPEALGDGGILVPAPALSHPFKLDPELLDPLSREHVASILSLEDTDTFRAYSLRARQAGQVFCARAEECFQTLLQPWSLPEVVLRQKALAIAISMNSLVFGAGGVLLSQTYFDAVGVLLVSDSQAERHFPPELHFVSVCRRTPHAAELAELIAHQAQAVAAKVLLMPIQLMQQAELCQVIAQLERDFWILCYEGNAWEGDHLVCQDSDKPPFSPVYLPIPESFEQKLEVLASLGSGCADARQYAHALGGSGPKERFWYRGCDLGDFLSHRSGSCVL